MREKVVNLDPSLGNLLDVDLLPSGEWAGIFDVGGSLLVDVDGARFELPVSIRFPRIRLLRPGLVVLVDTRVDQERESAWIFESDGSLKASFCAGDGVQDVLASDNRIVVTYFDEGVFGGVPPSSQGLVAFDGDGAILFEYQKDILDAVDVADCYCAAQMLDRRIVFSPYTGFPLVVLDIDKRQQQVQQIPEELHGAAAISEMDGEFVLFAPYGRKTTLYRWKPKQAPAAVGTYPGPLRGLWEGQFLAKGDHGFVVVRPQ